MWFISKMQKFGNERITARVNPIIFENDFVRRNFPVVAAETQQIPRTVNFFFPESVPGEWLVTVVPGDEAGVRVRGLVDEKHRSRLKVGAEAVFVPEDPSRPTVPLVLQRLDTTGVRHMADFPELMSTQGGAVAVRAAPAELARRLAFVGEQVWVPEEAQYRVEFTSAEEYVRRGRIQRLRGYVLVQCEGESLFAYYGRRAAAVLLRETGF